jgi:hypothetical protein
MIGIEGAIDLIVARLSTEMPAKVAEVAARYTDAATVNLRAPNLYASSLYERLELAQYPAVEVAPRDDGLPYQLDQTQGLLALRVAYSVRVYLTERGNGYPQVDARRKRLTLAVREVLFSTSALQASPQAWIDARTVRSSYFGVGTIDEKDMRSIAATYTDLDVIVQEMTEAYPTTQIGTADTIFSTVHPASRS